MTMAMKVTDEIHLNGIDTSDYMKQLICMADQLRVAEQKVSISIDREIDDLYQTNHQSTTVSLKIMTDLQNCLEENT